MVKFDSSFLSHGDLAVATFLRCPMQCKVQGREGEKAMH